MLTLVRLTYYALVTLLPLAFIPTSSELFEFPKFLILIAGAVIVFTGWVLHSYTTRSWHLSLGRYPAVSYGVLAVLATQTLATLFSIHPETSFWGYYSRFHMGLLTTLCYSILYFGVLQFLSLADVKKILKLSLLTALFISILAVLERYNLSATCPFINGQFNNSCWKNLTNPTYRSFATLGQPNWLAAYLIPHVFLLFSFFPSPQKKNLLLLIAGYCLLITALYFTKSRSGYLAFGLSALCYLYLVFRHRQPKFVEIKNILSIMVLIPMAVITLSLLPFGQTPSEPVPTPSSPVVESTASGQIRQIVWTGALKLLWQRPILGFGPETFAYTYYQVRPIEHNYTTEWDYIYNKAHNEYLNLAATSGLLGLLAFLFSHLTALKASLAKFALTKKADHLEEDFLRSYLPVVGTSVVSFAVTSFFGFSVIPVYLALTLFSAFASASSAKIHLTLSANTIYAGIAGILIVSYFLPFRLLQGDLAFNRGKALAAEGKHAQALPFLEKSTALRPGEDLFHSYLAESLASLGDANRALTEINVTATQNPHHLNYYKSRAKSYITLALQDPKYYGPAAAELARARVLAPTDPKLAYNLGLVYSRLGDTTKSMQEMQSSLALKNDYYEPYYALTLLYESTSQSSLIPDLLKQAQTHLKSIPEPLQAKFEKYLVQ